MMPRLSPAPTEKELWRYRELLWFLALRDVQVRYKQTALGAMWAIIQPFMMMVVLSYVLKHYLGRAEESDPIFLYAGLLPWTFFAGAVIAATNSLITNADMLRKIYFPRILIPIASIGASVVDFVIAFGLLIVMMVWYGVGVSWQLALVPLLLLTAVIAALGIGILMSALSVAYRDFRYVVPFLVSIGFFLSGVMYKVDQVHWAMHLNPMSGTIAGFRAAVLCHDINWSAWGISACSAVVCLVMGLVYFARTQRQFADVI